MAYYPHENHGTFIRLTKPTPPPLNTFEFAMYALDVMLDNLHRFAPADADFIDYFYCWIQSGGPRMEWQCKRTMDLYHQYGFDCARGWSSL